MLPARIVSIAVALACALWDAGAQTQQNFTRFTTNDGLAQNMVLVSQLDNRGFLWFGTKNGLSRYDGYTFKNFQHEPSDTLSIAGTYITSLHECPSGDLWIGFADGNIDIFHRRSERFEHLHPNDLFPAGNHPQIVTTILEDGAGRHWYSLPGWGVMEVERPADSGSAANARYLFTFHREFIQDSVRIDCRELRAMFADRAGGLWLQIDSETILVNRRLPPSARIPLVRDFFPGTINGAWSMAEDKSGRIWFSYSNVLVVFDPTTGATRKYLIREPDGQTNHALQWNRQGNLAIMGDLQLLVVNRENPERQEAIPIPRTSFTPYHSITLDSSNAIWLGTLGYGLFRYDGRSARFGLVSGTNWRSLAAGVHQEIGFPPHRDPTTSRSGHPELYWSYVAQDKAGGLWSDPPVANIADLLRFDPATKHTQAFHSALHGWQEATEWYGAWGGLSLFALNDDAGGFWVGRIALNKYDIKTGTVRCFQLRGDSILENPAAFGTGTASIIATFKDHDGTFWLGTISHGLYHLNPSTMALQHFIFSAADTSTISHDHVLSILDDPVEPGRYLWIGTDGGGLNRLDKKTNLFRRISQRDGLPDNVVYALLADRRGNLWMSTNRGLAKLNPRTLEFRNYDLSDGLTFMEFNREEYYQDESGRMYFGNTGGINIFNPEEIIDNPFAPPVVLTDLKIRNVPVAVGEAPSLLKETISEAREITLPYDANVLTLEFAALDFSNPGKNLYSHKLEGFENDWSPASTVRTATYTNLDPGEYTFRVRGSNCDGVWNTAGASLTIVILPPWYRTPWAYASYVLVVLSGLFLFRRYDLKRIRLKDQLNLEQEHSAQLREVDQLKMRFFQNVSHEFRTPLTLILGPVEKLLENLSDQSHKRELRVVRRNAQRLLGLINQILDISRLEAGGMKLRAAEADIVPFVRGIAMSFHSLAERKGIFLDVENDLPSLLVWFDRDKLEKVLVNLLGNAFKFTPDSGEIIVRISAVEKEALIAVRDTGIGMPKDKLPHIFDRFYQVDSTTTRSAEGTGIGLSLVKDLVDLHHGTIGVTSEPGRGSEFTIRLPLGRSHLAQSEIDEARPSAPPPSPAIDVEEEAVEVGSLHEPAETGNPLILVVEDNADVRDYVRSCLAGAYTVSEARDGAEGLARATDAIPDLVISDVMMPKMDGYELCSRLKRSEKTSHIPVILLTAKAAMEDKIGGLATGADDYLVKPFDAHELLARVRNLIDLRRKLREKFGKELVTLKPDEVAVTPVEQAFLKKVMTAIDERMGDESFSVEDLAASVNMSYLQLHRKLKAVTDQTAAAFIRSMRLKRAMELLKQNGGTVAEIAYSVGFGSPAFFTKCFREEFGSTPSEVQKKGRSDS